MKNSNYRKGEVYGHLVSIKPSEDGKYPHWVFWNKKFERYEVHNFSSVRYGSTTGRNQNHGYSGTRFHEIWKKMKLRCENPRDPGFRNYGGKGVKVQWKSFEEFRKDMEPSYLEACKKMPEKEVTIDRIDPEDDYRKDNCQWVSKSENSRRRNVKIVTIDGQKRSITDHLKAYGVKKGTYKSRRKLGWTIEQAIKTPVRYRSDVH